MRSVYLHLTEAMRNLVNAVVMAWLSLGLSFNWGGTARPTLAGIPIGTDNSFQAVVDVDQALAKLAEDGASPEDLRRFSEKQRLISTFDINQGPWNTNHPRHRLLDALLGYQRYQERQNVEITRLRSLFKGVTSSQKSILDKTIKYSKKFDRVDALLRQNQKLCDEIVKAGLEYYGITSSELRKHELQMKASGKHMERTSVSQTLKHFVRDWTVAGEIERENTFPCILNSMDKMFADRKESPLKVLLPGSGLNRLAHDVAGLGGFDVVANEWSTFMNVAYRYLEAKPAEDASSFHPFVDSWSHHITEDDMLRKLQFPEKEIHPSSVLLVEGDFTTAFNEEHGTYDIVLTYFFIDTARNLMSYFETIKNVLKPGGHWINVGPLLYGTGPFVQLSLEEVIQVTEAMGFKYLDTDESCGPLTLEGKTVRGMQAIYSFNDRALTTSAYKAQFWVAQKN